MFCIEEITRRVKFKAKSTLWAFIQPKLALPQTGKVHSFKNTKKNIQRLVINGEIYKLGDLFNNDMWRRGTNFITGLPPLSRDITQKVPDEK